MSDVQIGVCTGMSVGDGQLAVAFMGMSQHGGPPHELYMVTVPTPTSGKEPSSAAITKSLVVKHIDGAIKGSTSSRSQVAFSQCVLASIIESQQAKGARKIGSPMCQNAFRLMRNLEKRRLAAESPAKRTQARRQRKQQKAASPADQLPTTKGMKANAKKKRHRSVSAKTTRPSGPPSKKKKGPLTQRMSSRAMGKGQQRQRSSSRTAATGQQLKGNSGRAAKGKRHRGGSSRVSGQQHQGSSARAAATSTGSFKVGDRVLAEWSNEFNPIPQYYPGHLEQELDRGHWRVRFEDDGSKLDVPEERLLRPPPPRYPTSVSGMDLDLVVDGMEPAPAGSHAALASIAAAAVTEMEEHSEVAAALDRAVQISVRQKANRKNEQPQTTATQHNTASAAASQTAASDAFKMALEHHRAQEEAHRAQIKQLQEQVKKAEMRAMEAQVTQERAQKEMYKELFERQQQCLREQLMHAQHQHSRPYGTHSPAAAATSHSSSYGVGLGGAATASSFGSDSHGGRGRGGGHASHTVRSLQPQLQSGNRHIPQTPASVKAAPEMQSPWTLVESRSNPGHVYWFNPNTGKSTAKQPPGAPDAPSSGSFVPQTPAQLRKL